MKKILFVTLALLAAAHMTAFAYSDVTPSDWFDGNVKAVSEAGIINGYEDGTFKPYGNVTYAEALKIASELNIKLTGGGEKIFNETVITYSGYKEHWAGKYATYAQNRGIVNGIYAPANLDKPAERGDLVEFLAHATPEHYFTEINQVENAPEEYMNDETKRLYTSGILLGNGRSFGLGSYVTRAEVAALVDRVLNPSKRLHDGISTLPEVTDGVLAIQVSDELKNYIFYCKENYQEASPFKVVMYIEKPNSFKPEGYKSYVLNEGDFDAEKNAFLFETPKLKPGYSLQLNLFCNDSTFVGVTYDSQDIPFDSLLGGTYAGDSYAYYKMLRIDVDKPMTLTLNGGVSLSTKFTADMQDEVYEKIIALKERFPEGCTDYPCDGCNPFAEAISESIFLNQPIYAHYDYRNARVGDLIYVFGGPRNEAHWVVVQKIDNSGITAVEGNWNQSAHWGRKISFSELAGYDGKLDNWEKPVIVLTRYTDTDTSNTILFDKVSNSAAAEISMYGLHRHSYIQSYQGGWIREMYGLR